ncbi:MAG: hypothetical protein AB1791_16460 [Chloroflexota bacterium]
MAKKRLRKVQRNSLREEQKTNGRRPAGDLTDEISDGRYAPPEGVTAESLHDPRLAHKTSQSLRRDFVADYATRHGNKATNAMLQGAGGKWQVAQAAGLPGAGGKWQVAQAAGLPGAGGKWQVAREIQNPKSKIQNETDPIVTASMDFGPHVHQPHWGLARPVEKPNPFASRRSAQVAPGGATAEVQAQDAEAGGVKFTVTAFTATVAGGLNVTEGPANVQLGSQTYTATGTVTAAGPKSSVGKWDVGFLQTVYRSDRNFYYNSKARTKSSDVCDPLPVRDGDTLKQPWYGLETVFPFSAAATDTQTSTMNDTPSTSNSWNDPVSGEANTLDHTDGMDIFRSWLAVRNRTDFHKKYLRYADWQVDYSTAVDTTQAVGSRVTPVKGAGGKVTGTGNGMGGKQPELFDPVANDVAKTVNSTW